MSSRPSTKELANLGRAVRAEVRLSREGRRIVRTLHEVLGASVVLYDSDKDELHRLESSADHELAVRNGVIDGSRLCRLQARINDRWTLFLSSWRRLHPDAESLLKWAANKLAAHVHLPRKREDESTNPPFDGGGGSDGGAEVGIPIWWARNAGNN
jgi:hypothetical protein